MNLEIKGDKVGEMVLILDGKRLRVSLSPTSIGFGVRYQGISADVLDNTMGGLVLRKLIPILFETLEGVHSDDVKDDGSLVTLWEPLNEDEIEDLEDLIQP